MTFSPTDPLAQVPPPADRRLALRVTPEAEQALRAQHPWLFDRAIVAQRGEGGPGDLAVIFDHHRRFLAVGLYDPTSPIRVRVLQHGRPVTIDRGWFAARLAAAVQGRDGLPQTGTTGYRLVHGENDGLPGLVVDRYAETLVIKLYSAAWVPHLVALRVALTETFPVERVVLRLSRELARQPEHLYGLADGIILAGPSLEGPVAFRENGLGFEADVARGQKTGFFFDQRDNRARVERLAAGRRVLNVFAYTGGFSLYAARGGATAILSIDASSPALAAAERNFAENRDVAAVRAAQHRVLAADAFDALADLRRRGERFDLVIVDPPALAKQAAEIPAALASYGRLTGLALGVTTRGGLLVSASCSSRISAAEFFAAVHRAAVQAGRPLREIERTGHAVDHPVRFPEGAYLKCLFAAVE